MDRQLILTLLQRLFNLCHLWARRSLHCLLRIFSVVSLRQRSQRLLGNDNRKDEEILRPDVSTCLDAAYPERIEKSVVLACSSTPRKPPPARSYTRHTSLELYNMGPTCTSPTSTLRESPGSMSPTSYSADKQLRNLTCELPSTPETVTAEPARLIAPPEKPLRSMLPSESTRYERSIAICSDIGPWIFKPLETFTVYDDLDVPSWTHYVQPEGQLYFLNTSRRFHYLTDEHLCETATLAEAELFITTFERKSENFRNLPYNVEVVFEFHEDCWLYYMVDLDSHRLFWLDDCIVDDRVLPLGYGVQYREHFRHMFDFEYWQHIDYFPTHRRLQEGLLEELLGILLQLHIDVVTSLTSTSAYDENELKSLIGSVKNLQSLQTTENAMPYVVQSSARLMSIVSNERFFNFSGFHGARLSNYQSVRGNVVKKRSLLITLFSPILFYAPEVHLVGLEKVWVDSVVKVRLWKQFQGKIERDWEGFVLYATVLVNANVAFLAIPSVISDDLGPGLLMSPAGVVSQVSIIASLGSIIIGLLLVRQMRISAKDSAEDHLAFLENRNHPQLGLETLAILFSLPYALLMWGMATFLAAVAIVCFYNIGGSVTLSKRVVYGIVWLFIVVLIVWTILVGWEKQWRFRLQSVSPDSDAASRSSGDEGRPGRGKGRSDVEESVELDTPASTNDSDARSVRSVRSHRSARSTRSRLTASSTVVSSIGHSWRSRVRRLAERPKRDFGFSSMFSGTGRGGMRNETSA